MSKIRRLVQYIVVNSLFLYSIYVGFGQGEEGFKNISYFIAWIMILMSVFIFIEWSLSIKEGRAIKVIHDEPLIVPEWVDVVYDFLISGLFVYHGVWVTAVGYFLHTLVVHSYRAEVLKQQNTVDN